MGQSNAPLVPLDQQFLRTPNFSGCTVFIFTAKAHAPFGPAKGGRGRCTAPHRATPGGETRPPLWPLGPPDAIKGPPTPFPTITTPSGRLAANMLYQSFGKKPGGGGRPPRRLTPPRAPPRQSPRFFRPIGPENPEKQRPSAPTRNSISPLIFQPEPPRGS